MLWPTSKLMDSVIGVDLHAVVGVPIHPYFGPIYLWHTPTFPMANVFINGMPAMSVGGMGYFVHIPQGLPVPPTPTNVSYWTRYLTNIAMGISLMALTMVANMAIAGISAMIPKPKEIDSFINEVTGIGPTEGVSTWNSVKNNLSSFTQWQTWARLLMPPVPYVGAQGSVAVGSPNVQINGAPLAFSAPLIATSCSDLPIVPNAATLGFSNVMVGVTMAQLLKAIAVNAVQNAIQAGIGAGLNRATQGRRNCGCG